MRGPEEVIAAAQGGAHIADVEFPASALGTPYPLDIEPDCDVLSIAGFDGVPISNDITENSHGSGILCAQDKAAAVQARMPDTVFPGIHHRMLTIHRPVKAGRDALI